jgi:hypothetical protein
MYEIDLRSVVFLADASRQNRMHRLAGASVSSILSPGTFRSLVILHLFAAGDLPSLPHINEGDLSVLSSLGYLNVNEDKTVVSLT